MKKQVWFMIALLMTVLPLAVCAQQSLQKEINEQVWKPFIQSFNKNDKKGFAAVHSKDIIRVLQDDQKIWGFQQYFPEGSSNNNNTNQNTATSLLELRFTERIAGNDKAFEVGYYKNTYTEADGKKRYLYGKFHVVLRKENGSWKILVDADTREGATEETFSKASPIE